MLAGDKPASGLFRHASQAEVLAAVQRDARSVGIIGLRAPRGGLRALAMTSGSRSIPPDALSIDSEDYPLTRRVYFHTGQMTTALGGGFAQWVVLMGFADPQPRSPMQSLFMSQERADFVSSELLALNMKVVTVRGFGGWMNLLDASLPTSRYWNDRVEVWLR